MPISLGALLMTIPFTLGIGFAPFLVLVWFFRREYFRPLVITYFCITISMIALLAGMSVLENM